MKAKIDIELNKILGIRVTEEILKAEPKLKTTFEDLIKKMSIEMLRAFNQKKVKVKISYEIE